MNRIVVMYFDHIYNKYTFEQTHKTANGLLFIKIYYKRFIYDGLINSMFSPCDIYFINTHNTANGWNIQLIN